MVLSALALAKVVGLRQQTEKGMSLWPTKVAVRVPVRRSHTQMLLSSAALASSHACTDACQISEATAAS